MKTDTNEDQSFHTLAIKVNIFNDFTCTEFVHSSTADGHISLFLDMTAKLRNANLAPGLVAGAKSCIPAKGVGWGIPTFLLALSQSGCYTLKAKQRGVLLAGVAESDRQEPTPKRSTCGGNGGNGDYPSCRVARLPHLRGWLLDKCELYRHDSAAEVASSLHSAIGRRRKWSKSPYPRLGVFMASTIMNGRHGCPLVLGNPARST